MKTYQSLKPADAIGPAFARRTCSRRRQVLGSHHRGDQDSDGCARRCAGGATEGKGIRRGLRLVIRCRHPSQTSWSMSLILNTARFDGRIDCIDWEPLFVSTDGSKCSGFHRHLWNAKVMSCDRFKVPLPQLEATSAEDFIVLGMQILGVAVRKEK